MPDNTLGTCEFHSLSQLVLNVTATGANVSETVQQCENVCSLAWGTGNPDLSGIGANISYIMQVILVSLIGSFMCVIWKFGKQGYFPMRPDITDAFEKIRDSFMDVNGQFSISVTIAAGIRANGYSASFFELAFLQPLVYMQLFTVIAMSISVWYLPSTSTGISRVMLSATYTTLDSISVLVFLTQLRRPQNSWLILDQLIQSCEVYGPLKPFIYSQREGYPVVVVTITSSVIITIFIAYLAVRYVKTFRRVASRWFRQFNDVLAWHQPLAMLRNFFEWHLSLCMAILSSMSIVQAIIHLVKMEQSRTKMRSVTGKLFADDEWGFGQIIAVMLWIPFLVQAGYTIIKCMTFDSRSAKLSENSRSTPPNSSQDHLTTLIELEMGATQPRSQHSIDHQPLVMNHTELLPATSAVVHEDMQLRENRGRISSLKRRVGTV